MQEKKQKNENILSYKPLPAINERIRQLIENYAKGSVKRFSEMIKLSNSQKLNRIFHIDQRNNEYPEVSSDILISTANMFSEINTRWLLTGKGEKFNAIQSDMPIILENKDSLYYDMCKEKDAVIASLNREIGSLTQIIQDLRDEHEVFQDQKAKKTPNLNQPTTPHLPSGGIHTQRNARSQKP